MYVYMNICKENFFANKLLMMMMRIRVIVPARQAT
jgi:hypothetical protein